MAQTTLRLPADMLDALDNEADEHDASRSEYIRDILASRHEHDGMHDEYTRRIAELERENERLHRERRQLLDQRDEHQELVRYADNERQMEQRREQRRQANILRRAWWYLAGTPDDETEA
jgi:metal-responsive CopG/Arc/MetJ family transcriptional regulator